MTWKKRGAEVDSKRGVNVPVVPLNHIAERSFKNIGCDLARRLHGQSPYDVKLPDKLFLLMEKMYAFFKCLSISCVTLINNCEISWFSG
jgi:hypothetical protein